MKLAWATDLHFEMADARAIEAFCQAIDAGGPDAVLLGGDIGTAPGLARWLAALAERLRVPLHFVLGNHDYYHGDIPSVRATAARIGSGGTGATWLEGTGAIALSAATALVGHGGWGDMGFGNPETPVRLNDFLLIGGVAGLSAAARNAKLRALGSEAAAHLRRALTEALLGGPREVVVLTHVPPFREACWHEGHLSNDDWLPFFACKATGDVLREVAAAHPAVRFTVLCGHTHSPGEAGPLPNLHVWTAGAQYGRPAVARMLEVP